RERTTEPGGPRFVGESEQPVGRTPDHESVADDVNACYAGLAAVAVVVGHRIRLPVAKRVGAGRIAEDAAAAHQLRLAATAHDDPRPVSVRGRTVRGPGRRPVSFRDVALHVFLDGVAGDVSVG